MIRLALLHALAGRSYSIAIKDERHRLRPAPKARLPASPGPLTLSTWIDMAVIGLGLVVFG